MSRASEWADRDHRRTQALEEARARIDKELDEPSPDAILAFRRSDGNQIARVSRFDDRPRMLVRAGYDGIVSLSAEEALALAEWIRDLFGEDSTK